MQWSSGAPYYHDSHGFVVRTDEEKAKARLEVAKRYGITEFAVHKWNQSCGYTQLIVPYHLNNDSPQNYIQQRTFQQNNGKFQ